MKTLFGLAVLIMLFVAMYYYVDFEGIQNNVTSGNDNIINQINQMEAPAAGKKE